MVGSSDAHCSKGFNAFTNYYNLSRNIAQVSIPQVNHKYDYAIDFKMACLITRKYFNMYCNKPYNDLLIEIIGYIVPVRPNRRDKRNMKPKSAVWFMYRVA